MNDQPKQDETLQPGSGLSGGAQESGAGYGNAQTGDEQGGGLDGSGPGSDARHGDPEQADQAVQRSETIAAEDIEFAADDDLIDDDE